MKIYTRTGDDGTTGLVRGRLSKDDIIVETIGNIDELNASLGICIAQSKNVKISGLLTTLQHDLFCIGSEVAGGKHFADAQIVEELEHHIDSFTETLPPLKNFILPGGSVLAAQLHLARTICRSAERRAVRLKKQHPRFNNHIILFLNRLSDLLFVMARFANKTEKVSDVIWSKRSGH